MNLFVGLLLIYSCRSWYTSTPPQGSRCPVGLGAVGKGCTTVVEGTWELPGAHCDRCTDGTTLAMIGLIHRTSCSFLHVSFVLGAGPCWHNPWRVAPLIWVKAPYVLLILRLGRAVLVLGCGGTRGGDLPSQFAEWVSGVLDRFEPSPWVLLWPFQAGLWS